MAVNRLNNKPYHFFFQMLVYIYIVGGEGGRTPGGSIANYPPPPTHTHTHLQGGGVIDLYKKAPPERGMFLGI